MLENKVAVITGSGQGIGKHAAMTFAKEKAKVVIADFNADLAKKTATELSALTETLAVHADVREEESVKKLIDHRHWELGLNSHGIQVPIVDTKPIGVVLFLDQYNR